MKRLDDMMKSHEFSIGGLYQNDKHIRKETRDEAEKGIKASEFLCMIQIDSVKATKYLTELFRSACREVRSYQEKPTDTSPVTRKQLHVFSKYLREKRF